MLPATRSLPKEMLPLVDKPAVQYVVEELRDAGIQRILFVTGRRKRAIEDHFDADPELERAVGEAASPASGLRIVYTRQHQPLGVGDALRYADGFAGQSGIVAAFGDAIISRPPDGGPGVVSRLIDAYEAAGADAAVAVREVPEELVSRYGIVAVGAARGAAFDAEDVIEKPDAASAPSRMAIMGRYVLGPAVFTALAQISPVGAARSRSPMPCARSSGREDASLRCRCRQASGATTSARSRATVPRFSSTPCRTIASGPS